MGNNVEGSGRGLTWLSIQTFFERKWRKPRKVSVRVANIRAEILLCDFPNTKQECELLSHNIRSIHIKFLNKELKFP
jgi:hypothetical protein